MTRPTLIFCRLLASIPSLPSLAADPCQVHVILFVPSDVALPAPATYQPRIDQIVASAEAVFQRELKRHGHQNVVSPFRRNNWLRGPRRCSALGRVPATSKH